MDVIGRQSMGKAFARAEFVPDDTLSPEFLDQVDALLPPQPWPPGIHVEVAQKLECRAARVTKAIDQLIDARRRYEQINGILFDHNGNEIAPGLTTSPGQ
jgi:hypothetical protein